MKNNICTKGLNGRQHFPKQYTKLLTFLFLFSVSTPLYAQWSTDPANNLIIGYGLLPEMCSDSAGGAYVTYENSISYYPRQLVLKRIDRYGYETWENSRLIIGELPQSRFANLIADGSGGVIIAYLDQEEYPPPNQGRYIQWARVQRVDSSGNLLWGDNGVRVSLVGNIQSNFQAPTLVSDGQRGCVVAWLDSVSEMKLQHIDNLGQRVWGDSGISIDTTAQGTPLLSHYLLSDYILFYYSTIRSSRIQRINSDGQFLWEPGGVYVPAGARTMQTDKDGAIYLFGRRLIGSQDGKLLFTLNFQKMDSVATLQWSTFGVVLDTLNTNYDFDPNFTITDSFLFLGWTKYISEEAVLQAQILKINGSVILPSGGLNLTNSIGEKRILNIIPSNLETVIYIWINSDKPRGIYAQKLDTLGNLLWDSAGVMLSTPDLSYSDVISDGNGGCILGGQGESFTIRLQQINANARIGQVISSVPNKIRSEFPTHFMLSQNYSNPFNSNTIISFAVPTTSNIKIEVFNTAGQKIATLVNGRFSPGSYQTVFDSKDLSSGLYFYTLQADKTLIVRKLIILK